MAWTYGFYNSVNGDRVYNADQMSSIFEGLISDGVYESIGNKLAVQPNNGMTIQIATGRGWFGGRWVNNDTPHLLTLEASDVLLNRWVAVCVRSNNSDGVRATEPYLKYSSFATNPTKPTMERTDTVKEYCLAYIYIKAKATAITAMDITDTRQDKSLCGWVTGLVDQITPDTLYEQFTALFNEWFSGIQDIIDENVETMLVNALPTSVTVELPKSGWTLTDGVYKQSTTVPNMNATKSVIVNSKDGVKAVEQSVNTLVFALTNRPDTDISVDIIHAGV